jgi:AcrR family transcriptional regulator
VNDIGRRVESRYSVLGLNEMVSKKETKSIRKKEDILETAMELFLERGYSATSTNDICAAAHINKPTLYYYFDSKRQLFFSLHIKSMQEVLEPYLEKADSIEDPWERLVFMIREYTKMICLHPELKVLIHETLSIKDEYFKQTRKVWKKHYLLLRNTIKQLQSTGKILPDFRSSWVAVLLLGMITWITFWFDYTRRTNQIDEIADSAVRIALDGLRSGKNSIATNKKEDT